MSRATSSRAPRRAPAVPAIDRREHARRRRRLMDEVGADAAIVIAAAPVAHRNRDIEYAYRPDSDFLYLTGFPEPAAVAVLLPGRAAGEYLLFCRDHDAADERFHGPRAGLDGACARYGADDAFPIGDIDEILPRLLENRPRIWYSPGGHVEFDQKVFQWLSRLRTRPTDRSSLMEVRPLIHEQRLYKSPAEVRMVRRAIEMTAAAHRRAMARCRPGLHEYELEAELLYELHRAGCRAPAYPSIVAGGRNACVLHYTANSAKLADGDLVLVDAGAEHGWYAADVTRTWPVGGRFSEAQRALYELVLEAQAAAIEEVRPGRAWQAPHDAAARVLADGLAALGVLRGKRKGGKNGEDGVLARLHSWPTGHWLGLDVHDVGEYRIDGASRELEPGMVVTIEPGLYLGPDEPEVGRAWRGIGIRVEDVVHVTRDGPEVLSDAIPKSVAELERIVGSEA